MPMPLGQVQLKSGVIQISVAQQQMVDQPRLVKKLKGAEAP
jgi:hypothetical protein